MATFTASVPLNMRWFGHELVGPAGTVHRVADSLQDEFAASFAGIPGLTWLDEDEIGGAATLPIAQVDVTGLTAALAGKVATADLSAYVPKSGATMTGTLAGPAFAATGRPWFDVKAYGATGDGATDDTAAIQSAITAASTGGTIYIPTGTYRISSGSITVPSNVTVQGEGGRTIIVNDQVASAFAASGTLGSLITVNTNVARGATSIVLAASASAFAAEDVFWLQAEDAPLDMPTHKKGELGTIRTSSGSTLTINGSVLDVYTTAQSAKLAKVTVAENIAIRDLTIRNARYTATTTSAAALITSEFSRNVTVEGCRLYENNGAGVVFKNVLNGLIRGNTIERLRDDVANDIYGYGVAVMHGARNVLVDGNVFRYCRHGVTTDTSAAGSTSNYGVQRGVSMTGNVASECTQAAFDTHEDVQGVSITGNVVTGGDYVGIQVRGWDAVVSGNMVLGVRGTGIYIRPTANNVVVSGNEIGHILLSPDTLQGYGILLDADRVSAIGNRVHDCGAHGIVIGANGDADVMVSMNGSINNGTVTTGDGINIVAAGTRIALIGNTCTDTNVSKTQRYGIRFDAGTNADRITMIGNILSNNATGTWSNGGTVVPQVVGNSPGDAPGFTQKVKVTTGSIALSTTSSITVTWPTSFVDTSYTIQVAVEDSTSDLRVLGIVSKGFGSCVIRIQNTSASNARTGTIHAVGVHDT